MMQSFNSLTGISFVLTQERLGDATIGVVMFQFPDGN